MASINPYLTFNGNCEEAFNFYKSVFGGEFPYVGRFSEMPQDYKIPEEAANYIMHISLPIGDSVLMGSDRVDGMGPAFNPGNNFSISINPESKESADELFAKLSDGGHATMPMEDAFWGAYFGMLTDRFGIQWMINVNTSEAK